MAISVLIFLISPNPIIRLLFVTVATVAAAAAAIVMLVGKTTVTNNNRIIGEGDQTDDYTNSDVDTRTTINRANQETADNLTNRHITWSMVWQGLAQL